MKTHKAYFSICFHFLTYHILDGQPYMVDGPPYTTLMPGHNVTIDFSIVADQDVPRTRSRREFKANTRKMKLSFDEKFQVLNKHNELRANVQPPSSNMRLMVWNDQLAAMAQTWADGCNWKHGQPAVASPPFSPIGQNLYASTGGYDVEGAVMSWYKEVKDYTYSSNTCTAVCGHYTQVVWASTYAVGCGIRFCSQLQGWVANAYYIVCNYGPAGNFLGKKPYTQGTPCTACPQGFSYCSNNLCTDPTSTTAAANAMTTAPSSGGGQQGGGQGGQGGPTGNSSAQYPSSSVGFVLTVAFLLVVLTLSRH